MLIQLRGEKTPIMNTYGRLYVLLCFFIYDGVFWSYATELKNNCRLLEDIP